MIYAIAILLLALTGAPLFGASASAGGSAAVDVKQAAADVKSSAVEQVIVLEKEVYTCRDVLQMIEQRQFAKLTKVFSTATYDLGEIATMNWLHLAIHHHAPPAIIAEFLTLGAPIETPVLPCDWPVGLHYCYRRITPFLLLFSKLGNKELPPHFWSNLRVLVLHNANVQAVAQDETGTSCNALHIAAKSALTNNHLLLVQTLIALGVPVDSNTVTHALKELAYSHEPKIIEALVACGTEVDHKKIEESAAGVCARYGPDRAAAFQKRVAEQIASGQSIHQQIIDRHVGVKLVELFGNHPQYFLFAQTKSKQGSLLGAMILGYIGTVQYPSLVKNRDEKLALLNSLVSAEERHNLWDVTFSKRCSMLANKAKVKMRKAQEKASVISNVIAQAHPVQQALEGLGNFIGNTLDRQFSNPDDPYSSAGYYRRGQ